MGCHHLKLMLEKNHSIWYFVSGLCSHKVEITQKKKAEKSPNSQKYALSNLN